MNNTPLLSIIIPNYNKSAYIQQCIGSVLAQTYRPIEIVIVDDCSGDGSKEIIEELEQIHPEIKPVYLAKNGGVSEARNEGIRRAAGQYLTCLDSDDFYVNESKLENEMNVIFANEPESTLAFSDVVFVEKSGNRIFTARHDNSFEGDILKKILRCEGLMYVPRDYCFAKSLVEKAGFYKKGMDLFEDADFLIRLLKYAQAHCTFAEGTAYRQNTGGLSTKDSSNHILYRVKVSRDNIDLLDSKPAKLLVLCRLRLLAAVYRVMLPIRKLLKR